MNDATVKAPVAVPAVATSGVVGVPVSEFTVAVAVETPTTKPCASVIVSPTV